MNLDKIFIGRDGQQLGPYTIAELRQYLAEGRVESDDLAWCEGMSAWQSLGEVQEIQSALSAAAPPALPDALPPPVEAAYFHVAAWKFIVLSIVTFGIYELYWFYQNWRYIRERDRSDIRPFWRMVFSPIWCFSLCKDVNAHGGSISTGAAIGVAAGYFLISAFARLPDPWWLTGLLSFVPLLLVLAQIDALNRARGARSEYHSRFKAAHVAISVFGALLLAMVVFSAFTGLPGPQVLTGDKMPASDVQFLRQKKIIADGEQILFFYSAGVFSIKEDGSVLTDQRVISYTQVPETDDILAKRARFADIEDIRIERARSSLEDTRVTIITRNGPEFDLVLPYDGKGDEVFYKKLMTLWQAAKLKKMAARPCRSVIPAPGLVPLRAGCGRVDIGARENIFDAFALCDGLLF
jgi:hypothetical protein